MITACLNLSVEESVNNIGPFLIWKPNKNCLHTNFHFQGSLLLKLQTFDYLIENGLVWTCQEKRVSTSCQSRVRLPIERFFSSNSGHESTHNTLLFGCPSKTHFAISTLQKSIYFSNFWWSIQTRIQKFEILGILLFQYTEAQTPKKKS